MANHKRKRARTNARSPSDFKHKERRMLARGASQRDLDNMRVWINTPAAWNIIHHTRPTRRKNKGEVLKIIKNERYADDALWHDSRKPHIYFW